MLSVLAAIDSLDNPTLVRIVERTGIDKKTVTHLIEQARTSRCRNRKKWPSISIDQLGAVIKRGCKKRH